MKTIIFYVRKGARRAKQQGLATAPGSAVTIRTLSQMALRGDGRLYIVDAPTAEHGRRLIAAHRTGSPLDIGAPPTKTVLANGRVVALGLRQEIGARAVSGAVHGVAGVRERGRQLSRNPCFVFDDQDAQLDPPTLFIAHPKLNGT